MKVVDGPETPNLHPNFGISSKQSEMLIVNFPKTESRPNLSIIPMETDRDHSILKEARSSNLMSVISTTHSSEYTPER